MLKCLIAFILGWFLSRQMGNGFSVGVLQGCTRFNYYEKCNDDEFCYTKEFGTGYCSKCPDGKVANGKNGCQDPP